jgi:hypothetical protein
MGRSKRFIPVFAIMREPFGIGLYGMYGETYPASPVNIML